MLPWKNLKFETLWDVFSSILGHISVRFFCQPLMLKSVSKYLFSVFNHNSLQALIAISVKQVQRHITRLQKKISSTSSHSLSYWESVLLWQGTSAVRFKLGSLVKLGFLSSKTFLFLPVKPAKPDLFSCKRFQRFLSALFSFFCIWNLVYKFGLLCNIMT